MNFTQLKSEVATVNLGRSDTDSLTAAGVAINWLLQVFLPSKGLKPFLLNTNLSTVADQEYVALPSDFYGIKFARILQTNGDYDKLTRLDWDDLEEMSTGEPDHYDILPTTDGWRMYFRLIPDAIYTVNIWYYATQTTLTGTTTPLLSTLYGDGPIISGATWRTAYKLGIDDAIARWERAFIKWDLPELMHWQANLKGPKPTANVKPASPYNASITSY